MGLADSKGRCGLEERPEGTRCAVGSTQLELGTDRTNSQGRGGTSPLIQGKEVARVLNMFVFLSGKKGECI